MKDERAPILPRNMLDSIRSGAATATSEGTRTTIAYHWTPWEWGRLLEVVEAKLPAKPIDPPSRLSWFLIGSALMGVAHILI